MKRILFHGRGGQGAVTAAEILAVSAFYDGKFSQAFPAFGVERRGAPVKAFVKIDEVFIRRRDQIDKPDYVVILDPTLIDVIDVTSGLEKGNGKIILNTTQYVEKLSGFDVYCVDATGIALDVIGAPIVNTAMLGAFAKATNEVSLNSVKNATIKHFGERLGIKNVESVNRAYNECKIMKK